MDYIYCLIDPRTNLVRYIGKTVNMRTRYSHHCSVYKNSQVSNLRANWLKGLLKEGLKPIMEVIEEIDDNRTDFWEQHYISLYRSWGFPLTNMTSGGEMSFGHSPETIEKIRKGAIGKNKGKIRSEETKRKLSEGQKRRIREGRGLHDNNSEVRKKLRELNISRSKPIIQYTLSGEFIREWNSTREAAESLNLKYSSIKNCALGLSKSSYGFIWKHKTNFDE
jgi:group I intron endonuclease